jgi:hypothetical protein
MLYIYAPRAYSTSPLVPRFYEDSSLFEPGECDLDGGYEAVVNVTSEEAGCRICLCWGLDEGVRKCDCDCKRKC